MFAILLKYDLDPEIANKATPNFTVGRLQVSRYPSTDLRNLLCVQLRLVIDSEGLGEVLQISLK